MFRVLLILLCCAVSTAARADSCPGNPDTLGTERLLAVDTGVSARAERKQFPDTLPVALLKELKNQGYRIAYACRRGAAHTPRIATHSETIEFSLEKQRNRWKSTVNEMLGRARRCTASV
jgi:hypothetical protein